MLRLLMPPRQSKPFMALFPDSVIQQESAAGGYAQIMACQKILVPHVGTADLFRASGCG